MSLEHKINYREDIYNYLRLLLRGNREGVEYIINLVAAAHNIDVPYQSYIYYFQGNGKNGKSRLAKLIKQVMPNRWNVYDMRKKPQSFLITHRQVQKKHTIIITNEPPNIPLRDDYTWNSISVIPFPNDFSEKTPIVFTDAHVEAFRDIINQRFLEMKSGIMPLKYKEFYGRTSDVSPYWVVSEPEYVRFHTKYMRIVLKNRIDKKLANMDSASRQHYLEIHGYRC
jgi:hypothetical protein